MGKKDMKLTHGVLGYLLVGLLIRSHRSLIHLIHTLIRLPRTVCFARAIRCAHSLTSSPAHGKELYFKSFQPTVGWGLKGDKRSIRILNLATRLTATK